MIFTLDLANELVNMRSPFLLGDVDELGKLRLCRLNLVVQLLGQHGVEVLGERDDSHASSVFYQTVH